MTADLYPSLLVAPYELQVGPHGGKPACRRCAMASFKVTRVEALLLVQTDEDAIVVAVKRPFPEKPLQLQPSVFGGLHVRSQEHGLLAKSW